MQSSILDQLNFSNGLKKLTLLCAALLLQAGSCWADPRYALVIHGGAGADPATMSKEEKAAVEATLERLLSQGLLDLKNGQSALDVVEKVVSELEDNPWFNAGKGAALTIDGQAQLDACIMDGKTRACGAVASVRTTKNPIQLARKVMTDTRHVLMVADGADAFAREMKLTQVDPSYFVTERSVRALEAKKRASRGTVGCVAYDTYGNLAAGTSTGGLTGKRSGRVGDSPIVGAGTFADNRSCGVSCTGTGEEFIRNQVASQVSWRIKLNGVGLDEAIDSVFAETLPDDVGGLIAIDRQGHVVTKFNTPGMSRAAGDSDGLHLVKIGP